MNGKDFTTKYLLMVKDDVRHSTHSFSAVLEISVVLTSKIDGKFYDILKNQGKLHGLYPEGT